jgi:hypothetical protein
MQFDTKPIILRSILLLLIILSSDATFPRLVATSIGPGHSSWGAGGRLFLRVRVEMTMTQEK